jgi:hypothetical protein
VRGTRPAKPSQEIVYKGTADIREVTRQE